MWTARALLSSGEDQSLPFSAIEGRHASMRDLILLARELVTETDVAIPWHLLNADSGPSPWADAIPAWASEADASNTDIRMFRDHTGNVVLESEEHGLQVWHQTTAVVIAVPSGVVQVAIEYEWDKSIPVPRFVEYGSNADGELLPTLDGRLYAGEKSVILETDTPPSMWNIPREMLEDRQPRFRWLFGVADRAGLFIGRIARRLVSRPSPIIQDPGFVARLIEEEARAGTLYASPRIDALPDESSTAPLVIVVHGTFSCSVEIARRIRELCPQIRVARFEHDTFLPVSENVTELVRHLKRLAEGGQTELLFVAHSRGGLVACQAASIARGLYPSLKVWTLGTPHSGTPLAGVGGVAARALGALYRLCARRENDVFRATFAEGAAAYLAAVGQLPPGVAVMREGSDFLDLHKLHIQQLDLRTWGAQCNPTANGSTGHGLLLSPAIAEMFDQRANDLVVPTASAILDNSQPIQNCNHFQYFDQPGLRAAIEGCLPV